VESRLTAALQALLLRRLQNSLKNCAKFFCFFLWSGLRHSKQKKVDMEILLKFERNFGLYKEKAAMGIF
jgi:hypothetical protein